MKIDDEVSIKKDFFKDGESWEIYVPRDLKWRILDLNPRTERACVFYKEESLEIKFWIDFCYLKPVFSEMPAYSPREFEPLSKVIIEDEYTIRSWCMMERIRTGYYTNTPAQIWDKRKHSSQTWSNEAQNAWVNYCDDLKSRAIDCFYDDLIWTFNIKREGTDDLWMRCIRKASDMSEKAQTYYMEYDHCWWAWFNEFEKAYEEYSR